MKGSCSAMVDDLLDTPRVGLHIPPMVLGGQYKYSSDAVLMVLASDTYDHKDYIRNYDQFLSMVKSA